MNYKIIVYCNTGQNNIRIIIVVEQDKEQYLSYTMIDFFFSIPFHLRTIKKCT